jgi:hypothetical protein
MGCAGVALLWGFAVVYIGGLIWFVREVARAPIGDDDE